MTSLPSKDPLHQAAAKRGAFLHKPFSEIALRAALAQAAQIQDVAHE
jgi:FixJ family two-component response regulator